MKKNYMKPALRVVRIQQKCQILSGSVTTTSTNLDEGETLTIGGSGSVQGRARSNGGIDWDDWDE